MIVLIQDLFPHALEKYVVRNCSLNHASVCARQNQPSNFASFQTLKPSTEISCDMTNNPPNTDQPLKILPSKLNTSKDKHLIHNYFIKLAHKDKEMR